MVLGRGRLAKIDRRVFAELSRSNSVQAVKVPVSDAVWSTWRRYCEALEISMGSGVAGLIFDELETVIDAANVGEGVFATQVTVQAAERASRLDVRQRELDTRAQRLQAKEEHLREWERRLETQRGTSGRVPVRVKVGRNQRCPCGSGLKYKHCHGLSGPRTPLR